MRTGARTPETGCRGTAPGLNPTCVRPAPVANPACLIEPLRESQRFNRPERSATVPPTTRSVEESRQRRDLKSSILISRVGGKRRKGAGKNRGRGRGKGRRKSRGQTKALPRPHAGERSLSHHAHLPAGPCQGRPVPDPLADPLTPRYVHVHMNVTVSLDALRTRSHSVTRRTTQHPPPPEIRGCACSDKIVSAHIGEDQCSHPAAPATLPGRAGGRARTARPFPPAARRSHPSTHGR